MKIEIVGILICILFLVSVVPTIGTDALLKNTSTQPTIDLENTQSYFHINSKNWSYTNNDIHIQTTRSNSNPFIGVLSYKSRLHQLTNIVSDNVTTILEESTNQVIVVKLSSSHEIQIRDLTFFFNFSVINSQMTDGSYVFGFYIVNASGNINGMFAIQSTPIPIYSWWLDYFKLGSFIYDDRSPFEWVGPYGEASVSTYGFSLPAGDWFLTGFGGFFDIPNSNAFIPTKVLVNITDKPDDLTVMKKESGTFYGLWTEEFNPVLAVSRTTKFELMFRGSAQFFVNDTFLFFFMNAPYCNGRWNIYWETPTGIKQCKLDIYLGAYTSSSNEEETNWCMQGYGGSGNYRLTTSYIDRSMYTIFGTWPFPLYFIAIDVPLN